MNPVPNRITIYTKDVCNMTGFSDKTCPKLLRHIRKHFNKQKGGFITIDEFSVFTGIKEEIIRPFLI